MIVDELLLERVVRDRRFDRRTVEIARRLFIGKEEPKKLAAEFGLHDKRIYAIRTAVTKQLASYELPEGWSEVTLRGPAEVVKAVDAIFKKRMREHGADGSVT